MDRRTVYETVRNHLLLQGEPSVDDTGACLYRGPRGLKCGVGALIEDEAFDPQYNDARIPEPNVISMLEESGIRPNLSWAELPAGGDDLDFLLAIQAAHDQASPGEGWLVQVQRALAKIETDFAL